MRCNDLIVIADDCDWTYVDVVNFSMDLKIDRCLWGLFATISKLRCVCWRPLFTTIYYRPSTFLKVTEIYKVKTVK